MAEQINQPDFSLPTDGTQASDIGRQVCFSFLLFVCFFFCFFPDDFREPAFNMVDPGSVPGEGSPGEGNGYPL